jgi:serine/threonine protein kinase
VRQTCPGSVPIVHDIQYHAHQFSSITQADIWTLGVILYVTTTGRLPFDEPTTSALFAKIQKASFTFPKGVSGLFIDLVSKLLVVNPRERLQLSQIQQSPWCLAGRTASA